ncbi:polyprotein [Moriche virus]|uniref:Envelopment polyprotein n=1 Tax=Moriche virus TaxID=2748231 RepID=A0A7D9MVW7_9VIRU|nr:polyprotein [Moriche virus]
MNQVRMKVFLILLSTISVVRSIPIDNRCFADGVISIAKQMDHGIAEICIKDDISMLKTTSVQVRNTTFHMNTVFRKMLIQNYEQCNPVETANGPIMIFKPNDELMLIPHTFACRVPCTISLDEEEANIILHSDKLNHYEVMGTTTANRWFQGTTSYSLEHTCEHIQVTCGSTSLSFHACFKYHMACIRLLNKSYMPAFMIHSVCQNKELILVACLVLIIFGLLYLMTLTYICYILIPVFYPVTYLYGIIYNRSCKKCYYCGLAYHPLTKCGKNCVCGCMFENSERMKKHRESGLCKGYKSLRAARILCKNRGSSLILSLILSFLLLSFIQPIEGIKLTYRGENIELDEAVKEFDLIISKLEYARIMPFLLMSLVAVLITVMCLLLIFKGNITKYYYRKIVYMCHECDMTHPKRDLTFFGDFTNKCNTCMCGCNYNVDITDEAGYMIPNVHKYNKSCTIVGKYHAYRRTENIIYRIILVFLIFILTSSFAYAEVCDQMFDNTAISNPIQCSVWYRLPTSCNSITNFMEAFKNAKLTAPDKEAIQRLPTSLESMLLESEKLKAPVASFLLESGALKLHCKELIGATTKTGKWNNDLAQIFIRDPLEICAKNKMIDTCKCLRNEPGCSTSGSHTGAVDHYKAHTEVFKQDMSKVIKALIKIYPGILARELGLSLKHTNFSKVKDIAGKMKDKFRSADAAAACIFYLDKMLSENDLVKVHPEAQLPRAIIPFEAPALKLFDSITEGSPAQVCKNSKIYKCTYAIASRFRYIVSCNSHANTFYNVPDDGFALKIGTTDELCLLDPFCDKEFIAIKNAEKEDLKTMRCLEQTYTGNNFTRFKPIEKCYKLSSQTCEYNGKNTTFIECRNGYFYEYKKLHQSGKDDIGVYCFSSDCKTTAYPHHHQNLRGCIAHTSNLESRKLKEIVYENLEQLKHSLQEAIKTDLIEHKYQLTMNLPKMTPSFKSLSIMGTETDAGIESAYIETNIMGKTGSSVGIALKTKKGEDLFDIVLFVRSAHYESDAEYIYATGPTVGINMQHDEKCTGHCPTDLKKEGWLSFSKEHTSNWGCEEFGCLAINEGCVFGHCKDIIKPEIKVYKRGAEGSPKISLCVSMPDSTYCHDIDSFNPIISEKLEIQFLSNEAGKIPKLFAYKSNKVLTGLINDRGTFSKMCGSVQMIGTNTVGAGNARFDYICHAAQRKDITISRCFDNFFESCLNLNQERNMVFDDKINKISLLNKNLGEMRVKVKLGDIRYKIFEKEPSMDIKASCVGCIDCIKGLDCELNIISSSDTVCPIMSDCLLYTNNIRIQANIQKYGIKAKCTSSDIKFNICSQSIEVQVTISDKKDTIEVGNSDQTYFVKEKDMKCGTWLCKVSEQGISAIFSPFLNLFGSYGKIAFYVVLGTVVLVILIYLLFPVCLRFRDLLKHNDIEYNREMYGYKQLNYRQ